MGLKIALDTNCYVDFVKGKDNLVAILKKADSIFMPLIVLAELRAGFYSGSRVLQNEKILSDFLNTPRVNLLLPDEQTAHFYASVFKDLKERGTPIPTNDLWIAALVIQHDLILCTYDAHFNNLPLVARI